MSRTRTRVVEVASVVAAEPERVWARVVTPEGIADELAPWLGMSMPPGARGRTVDTVPVGVPLGRAWLRLLRVLPVEYDAMTLVEVVPGRSFREESTMLALRRWGHERSVEPAGAGTTRVVDRLTFEPRLLLRPTAPVVARVVRALFEHRHRRLVRHWAG